MYLVIDTETIGLPIRKGFNNYYSFKDNEKYNPSRMVQIAWKILDKNFNHIKTENFIVKRDNFSIDNYSFHGVTNEISDEKGVFLDFIYKKLYKDLFKCQFLVAHNMAFDSNIILNHAYRINNFKFIIRWNSLEKICTMQKGKYILKIVNKFGNYKSPSLMELYKYFYKEEFKNAHNALFDVEACSKCLKFIC